MKRMISVLGVFVLVFSVAACYGQNAARGSNSFTLKGQTISVDYGKPRLKGRTVDQLLGQLGQGDVWRLGADKSTTFATGADLVLGGLTVPKGEYSLFARKEAGGWKLVFNKQHGQWGTQHDAAQDLGSTPLKESKGAKSEEMVTINLAKEGDDGSITIQWGDQVLTASFKAK